ncbi:interleukin-5 receptor subunit alpha-like [Acanthopagrus latus]|uniref:interleukin-5 receptor subunit alpha-like n=1 Tax=Acanthopagrus latus TaxID=8177 RepID=UPI00187C1DE2|nr:interleukin-5 receptor subunit alpha-like [Acanthopagrus latus]
MMLSPVHSVLWFSLLVLWASQSETEALTPDVCQGEKLESHLQDIVEEHDAKAVLSDEENFPCYLYPANVVNCSWTFPALQEGSEIFVAISVCDEEEEIRSVKSQGRYGSTSFHVPKYEDLYVILQFNISLHNKMAAYAYTYRMEEHEVLSPPDNISVSVKDGELSVTWALPSSKDTENPECFEYQLDLGDKKEGSHKNVQYELSYTEQNADPSSTYRVRMRTRMVKDCQKNAQWSDWGHVVTIEPTNKLNPLVIVSVSLGIPMILLAVLLLVRYQRVSKILFPPIPRPPPKYKHFLQKHDTFNFFLPAPSAEPVEEITEVEDTEGKP